MQDAVTAEAGACLATTDLYPYMFEDAVRHLGRIFAVTSQGLVSSGCHPSVREITNGMHKPSFASLMVLHYFARTSHPPLKNKITDPGCAFASVILSNLEPCS